MAKFNVEYKIVQKYFEGTTTKHMKFLILDEAHPEAAGKLTSVLTDPDLEFLVVRRVKPQKNEAKK